MGYKQKNGSFAGFFAILTIFVFLSTGCGGRISRGGIMSENLPLTVDDFKEISQGEENHIKVQEKYYLYQNPALSTYVNAVATSIAEVSDRPNLPYRVFILDHDEVNLFGGPGGFIYITKGMLDYVESEDELAGVLAHEIAHHGRFDYIPTQQFDRVKKMYKMMMKGSEMASGHFGSMGVAAHSGLKGIAKVAPHVAKNFDKDAEVETDKLLIQHMLKAGYDPRAYLEIVERTATIKIYDISRFINLMNTHPPFPERRKLLRNYLNKINYDKIEFRQDKLTEIRKMMVNAPDQVMIAADQNILFKPEAGIQRIDPVEMNQIERNKEQKMSTPKKRWGLF